MKNVPGYRFNKNEAAILIKSLQSCVDQLNQTITYVDENCEEDVVLPYKTKIAEIMFDLGWEVLEQGFYKKYPDLRPKESSLHPDNL